MADSKAILSSDKSAAPSVALLFLCAFALFELAVGVRGLVENNGWDTLFAAQGTQPAAKVPTVAPTTPSPGGAAPFVVPPVPAFVTPIPSAGSPPAPFQFTNPLPPSAGSAVPPPSMPLPGTATMANPVAPQTLPSPQRSASPVGTPPPVPTKSAADPMTASTGNPQSDELLEVALQCRDLGDDNGALQAINRADLLTPNNPRIMREKSMIMKRLGIPEEPKPAATPPSEAPPPPSGLPSESAPPPATLNQSFGGTRAPAPAVPQPMAAPPPVTVNGALSLGQCRVERDATVVHGERLALKVPLDAKTGEVIDPDQMQLDVFFYDKVNGERVEPSMADKPKSTFDTAGDFSTGHEVISVLYNLPEFTATEVSQLGRHQFYGYVVKLYYKNRLSGVAANPPDLSTIGDAPAAKRN